MILHIGSVTQTVSVMNILCKTGDIFVSFGSQGIRHGCTYRERVKKEEDYDFGVLWGKV